ncbi:CPBP family intramembrane metalloprotease [Niveibacterium sp. 24ML]|uniref:CPBP family intramembrane glutamic endopeptidase n=1 Tax=Niveibacterium sp. 24ML TaxID=2985512 RepID=UPI00226FECBC|nr:CPBP family intramembrane glutamic endopeptidase [Niveibacterium sp. 24ML]MCX9157730.1 CPBP family intramembrane metalloprotease [Niveibacterium sp. 24ML]
MLTLLAYLLLGLAIVAVWLPPLRGRWPVWPFPFLLACACGFAGGALSSAALLALSVLAALAHAARQADRTGVRGAAMLTAALLALALALHRIPGFTPPLLLDALRLSADSTPFTLYARFDTGAAGLILLASFCRRCESRADWRALAPPTMLVAAATMLLVTGGSVLAGYVRFDPKLPSFTLVFLAVNLLFTCVAEEAFFRGLIQHRLAVALAGRAGAAYLPVLASSVLFGAAHAGGGLHYALIATLAGIGYGIAYARTRRIEAAVLVHFAVNALHFLLFSYPRLGGP